MSQFDTKDFEQFLKNEIHLGPDRRAKLIAKLKEITKS